MKKIKALGKIHDVGLVLSFLFLACEWISIFLTLPWWVASSFLCVSVMSFTTYIVSGIILKKAFREKEEGAMKIIKEVKLPEITCELCGCVFRPGKEDLRLRGANSNTAQDVRKSTFCACPVCGLSVKVFEREDEDGN